MQARLAAELKDPLMRGLAYGGAGYLGLSFVYSLAPKGSAEKKAEAPKKAAEHAHDGHHAAVPAPAHTAVSAVEHHETGAKQQVAPVLQQLSNISDRLTKIEKALGI
jgi:hypothetical protein